MFESVCVCVCTCVRAYLCVCLCEGVAQLAECWTRQTPKGAQEKFVSFLESKMVC